MKYVATARYLAVKLMTLIITLYQPNCPNFRGTGKKEARTNLTTSTN
jgi:hypothetical protein